MCQATPMTPDALLAIALENPITSGIVGTALATLAGFFRPIMRALQAALVRRIDRAWVDEDAEDNHDERIRKTADRLRASTRFPLPQAFVEGHVRRRRSGGPPPL